MGWGQLVFCAWAAPAALICGYGAVQAWREPPIERSAIFTSAWMGLGLSWPIVLAGCAAALLAFRLLTRRRWPLQRD